MRVKIVGIQKNVQFDMNDRTFRGINLFAVTKRDNVEGNATEKVFVGEGKSCYSQAASLKVGDDASFYYNRYGKIDDIVVGKE